MAKLFTGDVRFDSLIKDIRNYLSSKFGQVGKIFTPASPYGQILEVLINIFRSLIYYIEDSITELNLFTASRETSIRTLAYVAGHNVTRAISARGKIKFIPKNNNEINSLFLLNNTMLECKKNGLNYLIKLFGNQDNFRIYSNKEYIFNIIEGQIESQELVSDGKILQSYNIKAKRGLQIENFEVEVYVNGIKWEKYDSIYDMNFDTNGYVLKTGMKSGIDIYFGNGYFGKIPPFGATIRIDYIVTSGKFGNLFELKNIFSFVDVGYDLEGNEVDLNQYFDIVQEEPIIFGNAEEPIEITKLMIPMVSRSFVLANEKNFRYFLEKFGMWKDIRIFNTLEDQNPQNDNLIYIFLLPKPEERTNIKNYFKIPKEKFTINEDEENKILDLLWESGQLMLTTEVKFIKPKIKEYVMNIYIKNFVGYSKENIKNDVILAVSEYLLKYKRKSNIPKSDFIAIIENISGVDSVNVEFISKDFEAEKKLGNLENYNKYFDEFGDIIFNEDELVLIRGGWEDSLGNWYNDEITNDLCSINIFFSQKESQENLENITIKNRLKNGII